MVKNSRYSQNFDNFSRKKNLIFYTKIRSFMVGTKMKIEKFEKFVKNRRNITNFGDFSLFNKHHPVRPEPAAVLARSNFIGTFWKTHKNPPKFGNFSRKKKSKFLLQKWIVHGWYKNQKMSKILEILAISQKKNQKWSLSIFSPCRTPRRYVWKNQIFSNFFQ